MTAVKPTCQNLCHKGTQITQVVNLAITSTQQFRTAQYCLAINLAIINCKLQAGFRQFNFQLCEPKPLYVPSVWAREEFASASLVHIHSSYHHTGKTENSSGDHEAACSSQRREMEIQCLLHSLTYNDSREVPAKPNSYDVSRIPYKRET